MITLASYRKHSLSAMSQANIKRCVDHLEIIKSEGDDRQYRALELTNGMRVFLISDPTTDKSSAAMDIYVGQCSFADKGISWICHSVIFLMLPYM